jgi:NitT/TauT family transport system ATP-binding protein
MSDSFIQFEDVSHAYGDLAEVGKFAVENISLNLPKGAFAAIVGPSGCGKSTFMKLTTGLQKPTKGYIKVAGKGSRWTAKLQWNGFPSPYTAAMENNFRKHPFTIGNCRTISV